MAERPSTSADSIRVCALAVLCSALLTAPAVRSPDSGLGIRDCVSWIAPAIAHAPVGVRPPAHTPRIVVLILLISYFQVSSQPLLLLSCAPVFRTWTVRTRCSSHDTFARKLRGIYVQFARVVPSVRPGTSRYCGACGPLLWVDVRRCSCRHYWERVRDRRSSAERFASDITHDRQSEVLTETAQVTYNYS